MQGSDEESKGLSEAEAEKRLQEFGPNQLAKPYTISFLDIAKSRVIRGKRQKMRIVHLNYVKLYTLI